MRNESCSDAVLEADLGSLRSSNRRKIHMSGQKKIPVDQETGTGNRTCGNGDSGHRQILAGENGGFHSLSFGDPLAETPRLSQHSHFWKKTKLFACSSSCRVLKRIPVKFCFYGYRDGSERGISVCVWEREKRETETVSSDFGQERRDGREMSKGVCVFELEILLMAMGFN